MRSRFPKIWCESCKSMQFVGECPHGRRFAPPLVDRAVALDMEKFVGGAIEINDSEAAALLMQKRLKRVTTKTCPGCHCCEIADCPQKHSRCGAKA